MYVICVLWRLLSSARVLYEQHKLHENPWPHCSIQYMNVSGTLELRQLVSSPSECNLAPLVGSGTGCVVNLAVKTLTTRFSVDNSFEVSIESPISDNSVKRAAECPPITRPNSLKCGT